MEALWRLGTSYENMVQAMKFSNIKLPNGLPRNPIVVLGIFQKYADGSLFQAFRINTDPHVVSSIVFWIRFCIAVVNDPSAAPIYCSERFLSETDILVSLI